MEIPYEVTARRDTGLYNAKIGIWLFLASEVMLFGGLFSAYVFLRVGTQPGIDNPWPLGNNVQILWAGFVNTIVLIASSVFVVFAWVALKERKWEVFQRWMIAVVACAGIFMVIKAYEYTQKLTAHHDIKLTDNSILGGKILNGSDKIRFDAEKVTVDFAGGLPGFMSQIPDEDLAELEFKLEDGSSLKPSQLKGWFMKERRRVSRELTEQRSARRAAIKANAGELPVINVGSKAILTGSFRINANPRKIAGRDEETLNYRDRTVIKGKLVDDSIEFELHTVNLQMIPLQDQENVLAWDVIHKSTGDNHVKENFLALRDAKITYVRSYFEDGVIPVNVIQGPLINFHDIHDHPDDGHGHGGHDDSAEKAHPGDHGSEEEGAADSHGSGDHDAVIIQVPRDQTSFVTNHGPRAGTYYAIYFTMTGLHGLHVVGGALVLAFFLLFGKKMYLKNPEHLANRVEVGGLFWHFVDLVWIFLFPIMYLM